MNKILLSGATGFFGNTIKEESKGNEVFTIGRRNSDFLSDLTKDVQSYKETFDLVVHAAGKAHSVPKNDFEELNFFDVNVKGTLNFLRGLETCPNVPQRFLYISSVSVYGLIEGNLICEKSPLNASDAYGLSKIRAEEIVQDWCQKHGVVCTILRLPMLAGTNPPGNLKAMINGIFKGYYFNIGKGDARKSMVLAEDVAAIIPVVSKIGGIFNLTDSYHPSFYELAFLIANQLKRSPPLSIPLWLGAILARLGDSLGNDFPINTKKLQKITSDLTFDDRKAVSAFNWNPTPVLEGLKIT